MRPIPPLTLALCLLLPAAPARAQDDPEDEEDSGEGLDDGDEGEGEGEEIDDEVDDEATYKAYQEELEGESAAEELDAWTRYLEVYPKSLYRLDIERRMKALEDAAFEELAKRPKPGSQAGPGEASQVDAKRREMGALEPALLSMSPNTRRRFEASLLWGYDDWLNYEIGLEWAFTRQFSAFGQVRHGGRGFGGALELGAKYALVKDVRTGILLAGAFLLHVGYNPFDRLNLAIEPWVGFGLIPNDRFQLQTSVAFDVRLDRLHTALLWDFMVVLSPSPVFGVYVESKQRHSFFSADAVGRHYMGFHHAGAGVKVRPVPNIEVTIGANVPYAWRLWKDYEYIGIHGGLVFYLPRKED